MRPRPGLNSLPPLALERVAVHLGVLDAAAFARSCRACRAAVRAVLRFRLRTLHLEDIPPGLLEAALAALLPRCGSLEAVCLSGAGLAVGAALQAGCPDLRELRVVAPGEMPMPADGLSDFAQAAPALRLERLVVEGPPLAHLGGGLPPEALEALLEGSIGTVRRLRVSGLVSEMPVPDPNLGFRVLAELHVGHTVVTHESVQLLLGIGSLAVLRLERLAPGSVRDLVTPEAPPAIATLALVEVHTLRRVEVGWPGLRHVDLSGCAALRLARAHGLDLCTVQLQGCFALTAASIAAASLQECADARPPSAALLRGAPPQVCRGRTRGARGAARQGATDGADERRRVRRTGLAQG